MEQGVLKGKVTSVIFKGIHYQILVQCGRNEIEIQSTSAPKTGETIGLAIDPDGIHVMKKSEYSGMFGDYSSYSEEYEEISDATFDPEDADQEGGDEE